MRELNELKELYLNEIKRINKKGELTPADAEAAKKALEAIEMIDKICEKSELGYSDHYERRHYMSRKSDSVNHMISKLESLKPESPDIATRAAIDNIIERLETY